MRSAEAWTQRATFGAGQVTSQRRPREFMLHDVVPVALPELSLLVLLVVLLMTWVSFSPLELLRWWVLMLVLLPLTPLLMLMLLEVESAPAPLTVKHSRRARQSGNLMMRLLRVRCG